MPVGGTAMTSSMSLNSRVNSSTACHQNGINGNMNGGSGGVNLNGKDMDRCTCCPYGFHIDRDFVPFTRKMLSREANVERLRELRAKLRSQRKSMDSCLLGVPAVTSRTNTWEVETISRASVDVWKNELRRERGKERNHQGGDRTEAEDNDDSLLLETSLQAAVKDFEEALSRTKPTNRNLTFDVPDSSKFHTFPRLKASATNNKELHLDGDVLSSMKDSRPSIRDLTNQMEGTHLKDYVPSQHRVRPNLNQSLKSNCGQNFENEKLTEQLLKDERGEAIATRMRQLEEQVKMIPELQVKVTLLTEEKRQVMKLLDVEKSKRIRVEEIYESLKNATSNGQVGDSDVNQNVVPSIVQNNKSKRLTKDAGVGKSVFTRDIGNSPITPSTRSVAVGDNLDSRSEANSPTRGNGWTMRRRVRTFETGCQVTEHDLGVKPIDPILQIVEKVDCGVQTIEKSDVTSSERSNSEKVQKSVSSTMTTSPIMKTVSVSAKPRTIEVGVSSRPNSREIGMNTAAEPKLEKPKSKHVGVSVSLDKSQSLSSFEMKQSIEAVRESLSKPMTTVATNTTLTLSPKNDADDKIIASESSPMESVSSLPNKAYPSTSFTVMKHEETSTSTPLPDNSPPPPPPPALDEQPSTTSTSTTTSTTVKSDSRNVSNVSPPPTIPSTEQKPPSRIPRLATPTNLSPTSSPKLTLKHTTVEPSPDSYSSKSASQKSVLMAKSLAKTPPPLKRQATYTKEFHGDKKKSTDQQLSESSGSEDEPEVSSVKEKSVSPSPPVLPPLHASTEPREKASPSKEMLAALKVLNDALLRGRTTQQVTAAISIILHEWFRIAGTKTADPREVEDYLDTFESFSPHLLRYITNIPDANGNTALHYAVSHANFDVVSILLDSKVCDPNKANKAGYTSVMLVSLAKVLSDTHRQVVRRLFSLGDVNIKASSNQQTALMLAASHGRLDTVRLLLEAGSAINIQDEDGSTALMCASEHGHGEIVKYFLTQSDCDPHLTDADGSTALSVAMEAGHKDIGVMLYAHMHFVAPSPNARQSPNSSTRAKKSRSETPRSGSSPNQTQSPHLSNQTSPVLAKKQYSTH